MSIRLLAGALTVLLTTIAEGRAIERLVKLRGKDAGTARGFLQRHGGSLKPVSAEGKLYHWVSDQDLDVSWDASVDFVQRNHSYQIFASPSLLEHRDALKRHFSRNPVANASRPTDNPEIQSPAIQATGADPLLNKAWGMFTVGADKAWGQTPQGREIVVAVTDTGVDYNHHDLINNMWRNKAEIPGNGIDDDHNGYADDIVGWDFATNDNKPYDLTLSLMEILFQGGNPGHGTHVSGVVGARMNNSLGTSGVAPQVKIMALRFITEKGKGDTAGAIQAIDYAVKNGAHIINASWGGEAGDEDDTALKEAIQRAEARGVIFIAAAGNGRPDASGKPAGFDNDSDPKPMVPASFSISNIIAVAALDNADALAAFSNWGHKSVKVGAPGVKIFSTVPENKYQDTIVDLGQMKATWDGTSMAAPFVSGALAVLWSQKHEMSAHEVMNTLLAMVHPVDSLKTKIATGGRLDIATAGSL